MVVVDDGEDNDCGADNDDYDDDNNDDCVNIYDDVNDHGFGAHSKHKGLPKRDYYGRGKSVVPNNN